MVALTLSGVPLYAIQLNLPTRFVLITALVLFVLLAVMLTASVVLRALHLRQEKWQEKLRNHYYPLIFSYIDSSITLEEFNSHIHGTHLGYQTLQEMLMEMIQDFSGHEREKLQELYETPHLYNHNAEMLAGSRRMPKIEACVYLRNVSHLTEAVLEYLYALLNSSDATQAYSAAAALMASPDPAIRAWGLYHMSCRQDISTMAILELFYLFNHQHQEQMHEEGYHLREIIKDPGTTDSHAAVLIKALPEIGYVELADFIYSLAENDDRFTGNPELMEALITTLGTFVYYEAAGLIRSNIYSPWTTVRRACAEALGYFGEQHDLEALYNLLYDDSFQVRLHAVRALLKNGEQGEYMLNNYRRNKGVYATEVSATIQFELLKTEL